MKVACAACGGEFEAQRKTAKWCSDRCRKASKRSGRVADAAESTPDTPPELSYAGLVASTRRKLEDAGRLDSFHGQLAIQLAARVADADQSGIAGLSRELRAVMAEALADLEPDDDPEGQQKPTVEEDDEVNRARRRREKARQAAGLT